MFLFLDSTRVAFNDSELKIVLAPPPIRPSFQLYVTPDRAECEKQNSWLWDWDFLSFLNPELLHWKGLFVHMLTSLFLFSSLFIKAKLHVYEYMDRHFTYLFTFFTLKSRKKQLSASAIRSLKTHSQTQSGVLPSVLGLHPVQRNQSQSWHLNLPSLLQGPGPPLSLSLLCLLFHL